LCRIGLLQPYSNHITIQEPDDLEIGVEPVEVPKALEDGGPAIVTEMKELNLGTNEGPFPIYVTIMRTLKEEKQYFDLLFVYRDVFACDYKKIPGLHPRVTVQNLAIRNGVSPKKQAQQHFVPN